MYKNVRILAPFDAYVMFNTTTTPDTFLSKLICLTCLGLACREVGHTAQTNVIWLRAHKKTT